MSSADEAVSKLRVDLTENREALSQLQAAAAWLAHPKLHARSHACTIVRAQRAYLRSEARICAARR
eukprot:5114113-Pleurochrysis_carterae.AAC.1